MQSNNRGLWILATLLVIGITAPQSSVRADAVTDWNANTGIIVNASGDDPHAQGYKETLVSLAVFDAVNSIAHQYTPYLVKLTGPAKASQGAAAAQAAYTVLLYFYPTQQSTLDAQLAASLAGLSDSAQAITFGRAWGGAVANILLNARSSDGFFPMQLYFPPPNPPAGQWQPVPPGPPFAVYQQLSTTKPFGIAKAAQYRPAAPPALTSKDFQRDLQEMIDYGGAVSAKRSAYQTETAVFWGNGIGVPEVNAAAAALLPPTNSLADNARVFALINIAFIDSIIAVFDGKVLYDFWRPYTAIHAANPSSTWSSLLFTLPFQEYPSGLCGGVGGQLRMMTNLFGANTAFTLNAPALGLSRNYPSFDAAALETIDARVFSGLHFRNSCRVAHDMGFKVADYVFAYSFRPKSGK